MGQQTGAGNDWSEMVEKHDGQCCVLSSRLKPVPRKRCRDIMLGLLSATPSVGSVIWRSGMNGAGGIPFSGEVGTPLSLDEARAVVRGGRNRRNGNRGGPSGAVFAGYGNANVPTSRENGIRAHRNQTFAAIHAPGAK